MKVRIEIDPGTDEDEILIRCKSINEQIQKVQQLVSDLGDQSKQLVYYKEEKQFYIPLEKILFFESDSGIINAHTTKEIYQVHHKLYELEQILPGFFMRISKSTILNTNLVYSITKNITSSSIVEFEGTHKKVFVSRYYYKPLKEKLEEKRLHI